MDIKPKSRKRLFESSPTEPRALEVKSEGIPTELKQIPQWVCWKFEKNDKGKWTKVPINAKTGRLASSTNPESWESFDVSYQYYLTNKKNLSGIGFVFSGEDGFTGVDLDDCITEDGECTEGTSTILDQFNSAYIEYSPSGTGLKLWVRGDLRPILGDERGGSKVGNNEAYSKGKFFTVTGHMFSTSTVIPCKQKELEWFAQTYLKVNGCKKATHTTHQVEFHSSSDLSVKAVIEKISKSKQADKFNHLMAGNIDGYGNDHSCADQALLCILAFWCQKDPSLMEAGFNCSALADREKWRDRLDYRQRSISKAIQLTAETYSPTNHSVFIGPVTTNDSAQNEFDPVERHKLDLARKEIPFPVEVFPSSLQHLIKETSRVLGCIPDAVGTILLGFASIGVGNTRHTQLRDSWKEPPILYVAIIGLPGEAKSPIMKILGSPVYSRQAKLRDEYKQKIVDYELDKDRHEASKKVGDAGPPPIKPAFPHLITTDVTCEKLADMLNDNTRGVAIVMDELSALMGGMDQYKSGGKGRERQFFLSAWSGAPSKVDRLNHGGIPIIADSPFAPILGGIQPDMLGSLRDQKGRDDGWIHRLLFCYPPQRDPPKWGCPDIDLKARENWTKCFEMLSTLSQRLDGDGVCKPMMCRLTTSAESVWKQWYDNMLISMKNMDVQFKGPTHKLISYAARFSLLIQLLRWATNEPSVSDEWIDEISVQAGTKLADYFLGQLHTVYESLDEQPEDKRSKELLAWIKKKAKDGTISVRQVVNGGPRWVRKTSVARNALKELQDRGHGNFHGTSFTLSETSNG